MSVASSPSKRLWQIIPAVLGIALPLPRAAQAETGQLHREPLGTYAVPDKKVIRVEVQRLTFPPGFAVGRHDHPGPVIVYVTEGQVLVQIEGEPARTYDAGQSLIEPAGVIIARFDNASSTAPASFVATYLLGEEDKVLIRSRP